MAYGERNHEENGTTRIVMGGYEMTNVDYTNMAGTVSQPEFIDVETLKLLNNKNFLVAVTAVARVVKVASKFIEPIKRFQHLVIESKMVSEGNKLEVQEEKTANLESKIANMEAVEAKLDTRINEFEKVVMDKNLEASDIAYVVLSMYKMQRQKEGSIILKLKETKLRKAQERKEDLRESYLKLIEKYHVSLGSLETLKKPTRRIAQLTNIRVRAKDGINEAIELEFENGKVITHIYTDESMVKLATDFPHLVPEIINIQTKVVEPAVKTPVVEPIIENAMPEVVAPTMDEIMSKLDEIDKTSAVEIKVKPETKADDEAFWEEQTKRFNDAKLARDAAFEIPVQEVHDLPTEIEEPKVEVPTVEPIAEPVIEVEVPNVEETPVEEPKTEEPVVETPKAEVHDEDELVNGIKELVSRTSALEEKVLDLGNQNAKIVATNSELQNQNVTLLDENQKLNNTLAEKDGALKVEQARNEDMKAALENQAAELQAEKARNAELQAALEAEKANSATLEARIMEKASAMIQQEIAKSKAEYIAQLKGMLPTPSQQNVR